MCDLDTEQDCFQVQDFTATVPVPRTEVAKTVAEEDPGLLDLTGETRQLHTEATDTRNTKPQKPGA